MTRSPGPYLVGLIGTGVGPSLTPALHMAEGRSIANLGVFIQKQRN